MVAPQPQSLVSSLLSSESLDLSPEVARQFLSWQFTQYDQDRIQELLDKNNDGTINTEERSELDQYVMLGDFISVLHAKAQIVLAKAPAQAT